MQNGRMNFGNGLIMNWARQKYGVCRLFPDRVGFYKICERSWDRSRTGPGVCSGKYCFLLPGNYDDRSDQIQLLFERFLNPERVSMPDIDVDFCYERRQEVIDLCCEKIRKRQSCSDRDIRNAGGKRCDSRCGACDGYAVCFCRFDCEDDTAGAEDDD